MQYSPKLKKAMQEIEAIIKKNDIAGIVLLHEFNYSEFATIVQPSWSCIAKELQAGNLQLTIRGKKEHFKSGAERDEKLTKTCNMVHHFAMTCGNIALSLMQLDQECEKKYGTYHTGGGGFTSNEQQGN